MVDPSLIIRFADVFTGGCIKLKLLTYSFVLATSMQNVYLSYKDILVYLKKQAIEAVLTENINCNTQC